MPGIQVREKQIGDCVYRVTQFGALRGRAVLLRLAKPLGAAFSGKGTAFDIGAAIGSISEADFNYVCEAFAEATKVTIPDEGNQPKTHQLTLVFDQLFAGRYGDMVQWLAFAMEVNFGSFFADLAARGPGSAGGPPSISRPTPTGSSGVSSAAVSG